MRFEIVNIGTSLGGLNALRTLLGGLPAGFPLTITLVKHRTPDADDSLRELLQAVTPLVVREAEDKTPILPGHVYIAPANYHLLVEREFLALSIDEKVISARPSIDVLFESAADSYGS